MTIQRLHHAQITIPADQTERAREFYLGMLGLREIEKPDSLKGRGGFWMKLGDIEIHVGVEVGIRTGQLLASISLPTVLPELLFFGSQGINALLQVGRKVSLITFLQFRELPIIPRDIASAVGRTALAFKFIIGGAVGHSIIKTHLLTRFNIPHGDQRNRIA
jgi:catechol 2,3-dioxygenase-like lactoylglutathione lyase family enzyme